MGRISMFLRYRNCVLLYKSAYYKVITYLQETYSVLSTLFRHYKLSKGKNFPA